MGLQKISELMGLQKWGSECGGLSESVESKTMIYAFRRAVARRHLDSTDAHARTARMSVERLHQICALRHGAIDAGPA